MEDRAGPEVRVSFKKDGEIKVYVERDVNVKNASEKQQVRYTIDDLVKESKEQKTIEEEENVSD